MFGDVARKVLAQLTGPGGGERNWQKLKYVWDGKRHSLAPEKAEKEVRIYEGHVREMAQLSTDPLEMPLHRLWTQEEVTFDMGLGEYGITLDMDTTGMVVFKCYEEDWEKEARTKKLAINEFRLFQKYKGVKFFDEDEDQVYEICATNLEWQKKIGKDATTPCYVVLAKPVSEEDDDEEEEEEVEYESYRINDMLYDMIRDSRSEHPEDFQIEEK